MNRKIGFCWLFFYLIPLVGPSQGLDADLPVSNLTGDHFLQKECGIIPTTAYYYENFPWSNHGRGYRLYHNGKVILSAYGEMGGYLGAGLRFIDDTTGFFFEMTVGSGVAIDKITGDQSKTIGFAPGNSFTVFVVNKFSIYTVSDVITPPITFIKSMSDTHFQKSLIMDTTHDRDTIFFDTITGIPLCPGLDTLHYIYRTSPDTLIYTIVMAVKDPSAHIENHPDTSYRIYPNPARDLLSIETPQNGKQVDVAFYDCLGHQVKSTRLGGGQASKINIMDLASGCYLVILRTELLEKVFKLIRL